MTSTERGKTFLLWKSPVTITKKDAYISNDMQLQTPSLTYKNKSLLPAISILSRSPLAYNATASLDKLTSTNYVDFGKRQDRFGHFSWSKNDSHHLNVKLKLFRKDDDTEFRLLKLTLSKDVDEQLKLVRKIVDVVDRLNRNICVTMLRYNVDKPESSYAQVRLLERNKEDETFQQVVYMNYKLEEFIYLLDVMNSVYNKVITNQPICNVF